MKARPNHKKNPPRQRKLSLECLESRMVLDGGVRAFLSGGSLILSGDSHNNEVLIEQQSLRSFVVSSRDGSTLINGRNSQSFFNVRNDLNISLNNGNDVVEIQATSDDPLTVGNSLIVNTGSGNDQVLITQVHAIRLTLNTGTGDDTVDIGADGAEGGILVTKEAVIATGNGQDHVKIANSLFKRSLVLDAGANNDEVTLQNDQVAKRSTIIGGSGFDIANRQGNQGDIRYVGFEQFRNSIGTPPVAANDAATVARGGSTTIDLSANDSSEDSSLDPSSITITQQSASGTVVSNGDGTVTYTNNSNSTATSDSFRYTVRDAAGRVSNIATVTITITGGSTSTLTAVNDTGSVTEDATPNTATGNVLTNDTGASGTKTVSAVNASATNVGTNVTTQFGTFRVNADGTFTYTLGNSNAQVNALNNGQTLTDSTNYTVSAGGTTATGTLTITIQGATDGPPLTGVDDSASVTEDATPSTATGNVLTNDTGGTGTKTVTQVNGSSANVGTTNNGSFGTFRINADGSFTYTLNNTNATVDALNNGQTLSDSVVYAVDNGTASSTATLTITIQGHTDTGPLVATNDTTSVTEDSTTNSATGNVLSNDTGGTGTKTVSAVKSNAGSVGTNVAGQFGTFRINANGSFTYTLDNTNTQVNTLNNGQTLTDSISYTASAGGSTANATLTVTIQGFTDAAPLTGVDDSASVTEDVTPSTATGNVLTNDTGGTGTKTVTQVNGSSANVGTTNNGSFGTFRINADGSFTYTLNNTNATVDALNNGQTLTDSVVYAVDNGTASSTAQLTITIQGHTDTAPLAANADTGSVTEDTTPGTATGSVLANDTGGTGTKSVSAVNGNAAGVGTNVVGSFGTFRINADGTYTYTLDNTNTQVNALNNGQTLTDSISYTANAGGTTSTTTLTMTIQGNTDGAPLTGVDDTATVTEDAMPNTATGNVLTNDSGGTGTKTVIEVNGSSSNIGTTINGSFGTFRINADGSFTYTLNNANTTVNALNNGQTLSDSVTYALGDDNDVSTATLTITIQGQTG